MSASVPRPPAPDPRRFAAIEALFDRLVPLDGEARRAALAEIARAQPELHQDINELLAAHDRLSVAEDHDAGAGSVGVGSRIGAYQLTGRLGEGGMGEVFLAERADGVFTGQVAVKLTRATLVGEDVRRRFRMERQILASLSHPNIVRLLDGGATDAGQAYLIMEHVDGVPVTEYCRAHRLPLAARLEMIRAIADALQYAHQRGVVHRDLKPANVLVGPDGVPKVVDFGIAKLLDDPAAEGATAAGGLPGPLTPNYASPEQLQGLPVTTAADLYALGVLMYEVVSGDRPYETQGETLDRVLDIVLRGTPPRPSGVRRRDAHALPYPPAALRGDVDAIVMKAMAREPAARYASAAELAADITRWIDGDPILARAPSTIYVLRRIAARHKAAVGVALVAVLAVVAALGAALWQRQIARREQARAEQRLRDVRQLANALIFKIHDAVLPLPGSTPVRRTIVDEALGYLERLEAESVGDVPLQLELAAAYRRLGGIVGNPGEANLGDRQGALALLSRARGIVRPLAVVERRFDTVSALVDVETAIATIQLQQGNRAEAVDGAREAARQAEALESAHSADSAVVSLAARASFSLAMVLPPAEAEPVWRATLARYERLLADDPASSTTQRNVALVCKYLGSALQSTGDLDAAAPYYARAVELDEQRLQAAPADAGVQFDAAISFSAAASVAERLGQASDAAELYARSLALRRALAERDPKNVQARHRLAYVLIRVAWLNEARDPRTAHAQAREAIGILRELQPLTGDRQMRYDLGVAWLRMGFAARALKRGAEACDAFRQSAQLWTDPPEMLEAAQQMRFAVVARQEARACGSP